jgi:hypothetical protein
MPIAAGTRFGPYAIQSLLGVGGMGEVYRARDERLGRDVAIKVLPSVWTIDPDRRARFDREARALASLNHPNIGAIYGLEESASIGGPGAQALVLELVEGETLDQVCGRGGLAVANALGVVQTPAVSPDGKEVVYLSDNSGHGNLWVMALDGGAARQITFERDPAVTIGVPCWSPDGRNISYIVSRGATELWLVSPQGRGPRRLVERGFGGEWSPDSEWLYFSPGVQPLRWIISKIHVRTGEVREVRSDGTAPFPGRDVLFHAARLDLYPGAWDWELRTASLKTDRPERSRESQVPGFPSINSSSMRVPRRTANTSHCRCWTTERRTSG